MDVIRIGRVTRSLQPFHQMDNSLSFQIRQEVFMKPVQTISLLTLSASAITAFSA